MTDAARGMTRLALAALAVAALGAGACSSPAVCNCPLSGLAIVPLPAAESIPIASVSTDPPCTAGDEGGGGVFVGRQSAGTCQVRVTLTNGDTYTLSVEFRPRGTGCCGSLPYLVDASVPQLVDGGTGGPD